jgi:hypothetical protein
MKTTFGSNKHNGNYYLIPAINLIVNKARNPRFKDNYQFHFNFLSFHCWVSLGEQ